MKTNKKDTDTKAAEKREVVLKRLDEQIENLRKNDFVLNFFVLDSKNVPNSGMAYIYNMAYTLKEKGYKVRMVYQLDNEYSAGELAELQSKGKMPDEERKFIGVGDWMGEKYMELEHLNIQKEEWKVGPADFLFIPEAFSSLMFRTFKTHIPCKRYVILQNFDYVTEFIPIGKQWASYGIKDVVASNELQANLINDVFPYTKPYTTVIPPFIHPMFRKPLTAKQLVVNIIAKNPDDVNRIVQPFYWKYPNYKFVSFRDLRNLPMDTFAERLKDGAFTVWVDEKTPFGYGGLEAIKSGSILIGRIPENIPEWMNDDNGVWFNNINEVPEILANFVGMWMRDRIPEEITNAMEETAKLYTYDEWSENLDKFMDKIKDERIKDFILVKSMDTTNVKTEEENE